MDKLKGKFLMPKMKSERSKTPNRNLNHVSISFRNPESQKSISKSPNNKKYISEGKLQLLKKNLKLMLEKNPDRSKSKKPRQSSKSKHRDLFRGDTDYYAKQIKDLKQLYKSKDYISAIKLSDVMLIHSPKDAVIKYLKANSHLMLEEHRNAIKVILKDLSGNSSR